MTDIFGPLESTNGVKGVMVVNFYDDRITSTIFRDQSEAKDMFCKFGEVHALYWFIDIVCIFIIQIHVFVTIIKFW